MAIGSGEDVLPSDLSKPRPVDYGGGEALLVRRELFVELGGFDPAYDPAYSEDVDLCLRLRSAGWTVLYEPSAVVFHHKSLSSRTDSEWQSFALERSQAVFLEHWGPLLANAASADDPPAVLMPVPAGYGLRHLDLSQQVAADFGALERRRLDEYSDWLRARLRKATERADAEESRRRELEFANEQLSSSFLAEVARRLGRERELKALAAQQRELASLRKERSCESLRRRVGAWLRDMPRVHRAVTTLRRRGSKSK